MLAAWRRTSPKKPVDLRMAETMSEAAVSITITSVTDMISFWLGIISPFPSVQIFCTYSGFAVCFTFLWHITFFAGKLEKLHFFIDLYLTYFHLSACMAISGYREAKNRHSVFLCKVQPVSVAIKGKWNILWLQIMLRRGKRSTRN